MKETLEARREFHYLDVDDLMLDPQNPRLPEGAGEWTRSDLVRLFHQQYALDEIIDSMLANGFFQQEALIVLGEPDPKLDKYVVVEGNRRLSALLYIHGELDVAPDPEPTPEQLGRLKEIPCIVVPSREDVRTYLGFRHIGGIKDWSPEAKARFVALEVERFAGQGEPRPFYTVGRAYGSNAQGVRNAYVALAILRHAHREFGISTDYVARNRFGVWARCLNSASIREYIGFGRPNGYDEIQESLLDLDGPRLGEVLADLTPQRSREKALLADSRDVTDYGKVLQNSAARRVLREYGDLDSAISVVRIEDLPGRIFKLAASARALVDEVADAPESEALTDAGHELWREAKKIRSLIESKQDA